MRLAEHHVIAFLQQLINSTLQEHEMLDFIYHMTLKLLEIALLA